MALEEELGRLQEAAKEEEKRRRREEEERGEGEEAEQRSREKVAEMYDQLQRVKGQLVGCQRQVRDL